MPKLDSVLEAVAFAPRFAAMKHLSMSRMTVRLVMMGVEPLEKATLRAAMPRKNPYGVRPGRTAAAI